MEVRTQPVEAKLLSRDAFHEENVPGSFFVSGPDTDREQNFWFRCPCGCGAKMMLTVGEGFKPSDNPSWQWNGSLAKPSLQPSVHWQGHWHGWLTDGTWRSV